MKQDAFDVKMQIGQYNTETIFTQLFYLHLQLCNFVTIETTNKKKNILVKIISHIKDINVIRNALLLQVF